MGSNPSVTFKFSEKVIVLDDRNRTVEMEGAFGSRVWPPSLNVIAEFSSAKKVIVLSAPEGE